MSERTFDKTSALHTIARTLTARLIAENPTFEAPIRRQVAASADVLRGKRDNEHDARYLVEVQDMLCAARKAFDDPFAKVARDTAALRGESAKPPAPSKAGPDYARDFAAARGIDLEAKRPIFAAMATDLEATTFRALQDGSGDVAKLARKTHHAQLMAGAAPHPDIISLSRGEVAGDSDWT